MIEKNQVVLPLDLGICIPEGDFVFKVAEICESLDYTELFNTYLRAWRKVNPITIFEVIVLIVLYFILHAKFRERGRFCKIAYSYLMRVIYFILQVNSRYILNK